MRVRRGVSLASIAIRDRSIALAAGFVAAGYFTLTFYDLFAVRAIGRKDIPYRITALAAFTSYSIGHNVGASVFTGGAVRYRIYSAWGLTAIEVAKICFVAGLTFWLGNATVLGLGVLWSPQTARAIMLLKLMTAMPAPRGVACLWLLRSFGRSRIWRRSSQRRSSQVRPRLRARQSRKMNARRSENAKGVMARL